jgi:hypothetical protein
MTGSDDTTRASVQLRLLAALLALGAGAAAVAVAVLLARDVFA